MKYNRILFFFILFFTYTSIYSFTNLKDLQNYAESHPEYPKADNEDLLDPDYTTFHEGITPNSIIRTIFSWFGLFPQNNWNEYHFKKLLEKVVTKREENNLAGDKIVYIRCKSGTQIYVWSDIHGDFHSVVRSLTWFAQQKIIDNNLTIQKPHCYFVFNGDYISRWAYNLESIELMLLLLERNPRQVFYIRGKHENKSYWQNFGLERELRIRAANVSDEQIPLNSWINRFFNTLPHAAYFSIEGKPSEVIRISHFARREDAYYEKYRKNTLQNSPITYIDVTKNTNKQPFNVKAIIKGQDLMVEQPTSTGLSLLNQDFGATAWSVLSAPIMAHQKYLGLLNDAFAVINLQNTIDNSTITLYQNDPKNTHPKFKKYNTYNIVTGIAENNPTYQQERKEDFVIGSTMALELGVPIMGKHTKRGLLTRIKQINQQGGIKGHHIRAIIHNDDYVPYLARKNIINFIKKDIKTIVLPVGSPTLDAYLDYIREKEIAVLFPITGSPSFRKPDLKGLINWRATYSDEVFALIDYFITKYNIKKFAFFYQDDAYGQGALKAAHQKLKNNGITEWVDIPHTRATIDFAKQVQILQESQVEAIGFFSTALTTGEFIRQVGISTLVGKQLFGISFLGEKSFRRFLEQLGLHILLGSVVPNPRINDLEIVKEYRAAMDAHNYSYDLFSLEAYITSSILIDILQQLEAPFTINKILNKFESLNNYKFKGLTLTFDPERRDLAQYVWLETEPDKQWVQKNIDKNNRIRQVQDSISSSSSVKSAKN